MNTWTQVRTLLENQAGSIVRILGMHKHWAELFDREFGPVAFSIAKMARMLMDETPLETPWNQDPMTAVDIKVRGSSPLDMIQPELTFILGGIVQTLGVESKAELIEILRKSPKTAKAINSISINAPINDLKQIFADSMGDVYASKPNPADVFLPLGGGWYWQNLRTSDCPPEAKMMGHCGMDSRGTLYSLRDPKNKPHTTITYDEKRNAVFQIKGKQNKLPDQKYWPAIKAFFEKTGAGLVDRTVIHSDLGRQLGKGSPKGELPPVVAQVEDHSWINDPELPGGYFLVPNDQLEEFNEIPRDHLEYMGFGAAWVDGGELDYSLDPGSPLNSIEPLFQVLKRDNPDLTIRQEHGEPPPEMGMGPAESLALEHARMMGPVAYAEALARAGDVHDGLRLEYLSDVADDRQTAIRILKDVVSRNWDLLVGRGVDPEGMKYLGTGNNGTAWQLADGRVLKITTDDAEAHVASFLKGKKFKHIFTVYDVWAFPGQYNGHHIYGLVTESGLTKPSEQERAEFDQMCKQIEMSYGEENENGDKEAAIDLWNGDLRKALQGFMASDIHPNIKRQVLQSVKRFDLPGIAADIKRIGFQADLHSGNIMKRSDGTYVVIDIGTGGNDENDTPPFLEQLDLEGLLSEVGILGAPQAGSGSQLRGAGTSAWSGGKLVLADPKDHVPVDPEDEENQSLDQSGKFLGPRGSNSPY